MQTAPEQSAAVFYLYGYYCLDYQMNKRVLKVEQKQDFCLL